MKITELSIQNRSIHLEHINMDFASKGLYLLIGENGCGKTTLIEKILFGTEAGFESKEEETLYTKARHNLFAYCPQKIVQNRLVVEKYITKGNPSINHSEINQLLQCFDLTPSILSQRFDNLSGGEQMKVSIICSFLKKTPYVFLDEPSNYLDNFATEALRKLLISASQERCIILVTHDKRLTGYSTAEYVFSEDTIYQRSHQSADMSSSENAAERINLGEGDLGLSGSEPNDGKPSNGYKAPGLLRLLGYFGRNGAIICTLLMSAVLAVFMLTQAEKELRENVTIPEEYSEGVILIQDFGYEDRYAELYRKASGLQVVPGCEERRLLAADIPELAEQHGVKRIFLFAKWSYIDKVSQYINAASSFLLYDSTNLYHPCDEICPVAFPLETIQSSSWNTFFLQLLAGRPPKDNANEIAVSQEFLTQCLGYDKETLTEALGTSIQICLPSENTMREYTVVGIMALPFEMISYEEGMNYGGYWYSEDTYEDFCASERRAYTSLFGDGSGLPEAYFEVLVYVEEDREKDVLEYIYTNYPFSPAFSNHRDEVLHQATIRMYGIKMIGKIALISLLLLILTFAFCRNSVRYNVGLLWEFGNYYLNRRRVFIQYLSIVLAANALVFLLIWLVALRLSHFGLWMTVYIFIFWLSTSIAIILSALVGRRRTVKEYGIEI